MFPLNLPFLNLLRAFITETSYDLWTFGNFYFLFDSILEFFSAVCNSKLFKVSRNQRHKCDTFCSVILTTNVKIQLKKEIKNLNFFNGNPSCLCPRLWKNRLKQVLSLYLYRTNQPIKIIYEGWQHWIKLIVSASTDDAKPVPNNQTTAWNRAKPCVRKEESDV